MGDLLANSVCHDLTDGQFLITARSDECGYRHNNFFKQFLENVQMDAEPTKQKNANTTRLQRCVVRIASTKLSSLILPFVEENPCEEQSISILTQSSANGLVKWTSRLLAIGNALPLVAEDAAAAVITLFDLYILTVFRLCAGSKLNEDVLIGCGRGTTARPGSSTSVSLTVEADAVAPVPREKNECVQLQEFITSSRARLENIVNLDKFQSSSDQSCPTSPRSKDAVTNFAKRLEKEAAAAYSCLFAAILVDVASQMFSHEQEDKPLWDDLRELTTSLDDSHDSCGSSNRETLEAYATAVVSAVPKLVTQTTRFATVNAISGKEIIFQIICCGRAWEDNSMQEQSNDYVDNICGRSALIWEHMASSMRLPIPALQFTWDQLVWSAFMLMLEGFSKVPKCSTEGRSLMSMDLATLSHGLMPESVLEEIDEDYAAISLPPQACRNEMMRYVDTFIKVFYFPNEVRVPFFLLELAVYVSNLQLLTNIPLFSSRISSTGLLIILPSTIVTTVCLW